MNRRETALHNSTDRYILQGRIQEFMKGGSYMKVGGVGVADFISFLLNIL